MRPLPLRGSSPISGELGEAPPPLAVWRSGVLTTPYPPDA